jgi:hypothetical protein
MRLLATVAVIALSSSGCAVVVHGSKLSDRPTNNADRSIYLSTGTPTERPFKTLGFAQVRGYGVSVAGAVEMGEAGLDSAIRGFLATAATQMGGNGVINIEFQDENPQTPADRAQSMSNSINNLASGKGGPETKDRYVTVTGEVIQFLDR